MTIEPALQVPERERTTQWTHEQAVRELVRGQLEILGPTTAPAVADRLSLPPGEIDVALAELEREGFVLRGRFTPGLGELEWCERRLLARIHRYTLDRLRREIEPVSPADFMKFLFRWQRVTPESRAHGPEGLAAVLELLDGCELPAAAWESEVLPARMEQYDPLWLDGLCLSGEIAWARISAPAANGDGRRTGPIRTTPIALYRRGHTAAWRALRGEPAGTPALSTAAEAVYATLQSRGASFFAELVQHTRLLRTEVETGLSELVAWGLVSSDSFAGLRALLIPSDRRRPLPGGRRRVVVAPFGIETAGRWAGTGGDRGDSGDPSDEAVHTLAWQLLRRYGVVFRAVLGRETIRAAWRDVLRVYRRLEARGEVRGGRFVNGFSGEQYALPEAIGLLRSVRRDGPTGELVAVGGADPLNLAGVLTPGPVVPATLNARILYRDGVPIAISAGRSRDVEFLAPVAAEDQAAIRTALVRRPASPMVRKYLAKSRGGR